MKEFVKRATEAKVPVHMLGDFYEKNKHHIGTQYTQKTRISYGTVTRQFIKFLQQTEEDQEQEKNKKKHKEKNHTLKKREHSSIHKKRIFDNYRELEEESSTRISSWY